MSDIAGFGLYVHWPFCEAKCPYCDFNSHVSRSIDNERWKRAYISEIKRYADEIGPRVLNSIFFGGGTPSLMPAQTVEEIIREACAKWTPANDLEVTLEANPSSAEADRFRGYATAGVNRVSIGVQSLRPDALRQLGRLHSVEEAKNAVNMARRIFPRFSFDLIYARQEQSLSAWREELSEALQMGSSHLSLYQLTIEEGTAFGERYQRGGLKGLPNEDLAADLFELTQELTNAAGLPAYEISNHAANGQESIHNKIYWNSGDWVGIGPGAHGRLSLGEKRFSTMTKLQPGAWLENVEKSGSGESNRDTLSESEELDEAILMGLRLVDGVELTPKQMIKLNNINYLIESDLITVAGNRLRATKTGFPVLNYVLRLLVA